MTSFRVDCHVGATRGALKAPGFVEEISSRGHEVNVIISERARHFVGPLSFPESCTVNASAPPGDDRHRVIVHYSADSGAVARLANGLISVTPEIQTYLFPETGEHTADHPAIRHNVELLERDGVVVLEGAGGKVLDPFEAAAVVLGGIGRESGEMRGLRVLVTAGGTHEDIDSVRFIGNRSSGKMGIAVAREAFHRGASVTVVAANIADREPGVAWVPVGSVEEMKREVDARVPETDVIVMAAAVSDFTPASRLDGKIRRGESRTMILELEATSDILGGVREAAGGGNEDLFVVGFAATHGDPVPDAREKLEKKGADIIVGNDISRAGIGFSSDENEVHIVGRTSERFVAKAPKSEVAKILLEVVNREIHLNRQRSGG